MAKGYQDPAQDQPLGTYDQGRADRELAKPVFDPGLTTRAVGAVKGLGARALKSTGDAVRSFSEVVPNAKRALSRSTRGRR